MSIQEQQYQELAGEPDHLQTMAQHYLDIADAIQRSVNTLRTIHDTDENKSKATDALKSSAGDVADDIDKAQSRYRITAQALLEYVPHLRTAKADAHTAVVKIQHYQSEVSSTSMALDQANDTLKDAPDTQKDDATTAQSKAKTAASDATTSLSYWQGQWRDHANARDTAARTAAGKIVDVVQHHNNGLKNPEHHWYSGITHFASSVWHGIEKAGKWLGKNFEAICKWAGVLSIFLGWVPILGDVLIGLAIIGALITMGKDIAAGKGFMTILGDAVAVVLTAWGGGLTKYIGKLGKFDRAFAAVSKKSPAFLKSKVFTKTFGITKSRFTSAFQQGRKLPKDMVAPGMKNMMKDVRNPFKFEVTHGSGLRQNIMNNLAKTGEKGTEFVKTYGGLAIPKLNLTGDFAGLSHSAKVMLVAADGRKVAGNIEKIYNTQGDVRHHDGSLTGDHSTQIKLKPESVLFNLPHAPVTHPR